MQKPELLRIFKDLAAKVPNEQKEKAAMELQSVYYKYIQQSDELFNKIQKLINSSEIHEKFGGILALDQLTTTVQEAQALTFVNKFIPNVSGQFQYNDEKFLRKSAEVFGKLLRLGGTKIAQVVDSHFVEAQNQLKSDRYKLAGVLCLKEILNEAASITFNKLFQTMQTDRNFTLIHGAIRSKQYSLREAALDLFSEIVKQIAQREQSYQDYLVKIYTDEIESRKKSKEEEYIHGNIMMIKILLTYAKQDVFSQQQIYDQGEYVLSKKDHKSSIINRAVIETLPILAKHAKHHAVQEFMEQSISFLLSQTVLARSVKDKSLPYMTLAMLISFLNENMLQDLIKKVILHIRQELLQKNFCVEMIHCLQVIFQNYTRKFAEFTSVDVLVDQILLNGLHPQSVQFLNQLCIQQPRQSDYIQQKLLQTIAAILLRKIINFVNPKQQNFDGSILNDFQGYLQKAITTTEFRSPEAIANAIQTLSTFSFDLQDSLAIFVKDAVLPNLANSNPIIRKATAKAGCLLYIKKGRSTGQQMISKNVMYEILDKFMNVAISDTEQDIRQTMLASLNENFDPYLNSPNNLRKLFLCMNDPIPEVQEIALTILCRLSILNPSEIIPFLKKTLFEYLQTLTFDSNQPEKQTINKLYLLTSLIKHGRTIVQPYTSNIAKVIQQHLKNPNTNAIVTSYLLKAFAQLTETANQEILVNLKEVFDIIITAMQDKSSTLKREAAVKSLNLIIKNTGFVVLPYYRFPNLMDVIFQLIRTETIPEMRQECLKLLGNLGAVDSFIYKSVQGVPTKQKFKFLKNYQNALNSVSSSELMNEVRGYSEDLILIGNFSTKMFLHLGKLKMQTDQDTLLYQNNNAMITKSITLDAQSHYHQAINSQDIEELFQQVPVIQLNDIDYYSKVTLKTLLQILLDPSLSNNHELALETIMWIIGTLKAKTASYLNYLIPVFARLLQRNEEMREKVLTSLQKVIHLCGIQFNPQYIDQVIACVMLFCQGQESSKLVLIGLEIMETLIKSSKQHLRHKVEPLVRLINQEISQFEEEKDLVRKGIKIYILLENLLDCQLHMFIPFMCKLLSKEVSSVLLEVRKDIINLFVSLSRKCPTTVQYLSLIVNSLLNLVELSAKTHQQLEMHQTVLNCIVNLILQHKNLMLVYLPMIHLQVQKYKIHHQQYQKLVEIFLMYGNLEDLNNLLDEDCKAIEQLFPSQITQYYSIEPNAPMYKKIEPEELVAKFDTEQRNLKEEWQEWMRNTSVELLKLSPFLVLSPCSSIAEMYQTLAYELFNIAFDSAWYFLNDKHKELMVQYLVRVIKADNIPLQISQTILNLAEFMQHDKEGLQIDISSLGELAEKCMAYAKALYYREHEFETANSKAIQSLISLYTNLGLQESANGLLTYAKQSLKIQVQNTDYERLKKWDEALQEYRQQQLKYENDQRMDLAIKLVVPKMRCLNALMQWQTLISQAEEIFRSNEDAKQKEIAHLAANAAMHLGQWDKLATYNEQVNAEESDKPFWKAAVCISKGQLDEAKIQVRKSRERLDGLVTGLLQESYDRAQDGVLKLQQLVEMEEIIEIKQFENKVQKAAQENVGEYSYIKLLDELEIRKKKLKDIWHDRLSGAPKDIDVWYRLLSTRQLYLPKVHDLDIWIKFAKLCLKRQKMVLCKSTIEILKEQFQNQGLAPLPVTLHIFNMQFEYVHAKHEIQILDQVREYFTNQEQISSIDSKLKAKTFFTLGKWAYERAESTSDLEQITKQFDESLQYNSTYAKAWHYYGLCNFEVIEQQENRQSMNAHVFAAVKGFLKSISLGSRDIKKGRYILQDTLRLLSLIFKYGMEAAISDEFRQNYKQIDVIAWIDVIPQILARIQIQNPIIQQLLQDLLIHISRIHPQALIYPLTVACKSKNQIKRLQVLKILDDMKKHSPILVNEALIISEELNRTAILLKEAWREGIQEAWTSFSQDKNKTHVERILRGLHDNMRVKLESLSEISFHQTYGQEIFEAEAWLQRYLRTEDQVCLCVAFDIYTRIYHKVQKSLEKMKKVHLENVSPKLLATQNCEISIPGLYKPNKQLITINGFAPRLDVLSSKQHPRQVKIFGNDSKEYQFLLKGHEDLRQDERVMQLFSLVNRLLTNDTETERKDLTITRYSVIPLSHNTGLLGWVQNCDTLQQLVREYRDKYAIRSNAESTLMEQFCAQYQNLPLPNKVEIYRHILENTRGEDLQKVLWIKSPNSEVWLERRINYTRSLATMSMVGYILGLGDRHPSNFMLQKLTGKIVHIDFGDCFEVAMKREKYPERVPFRLTRMLVKAMEACGIEGVYRHTCNVVMRVLRENKESLLAVLDSFVYDPLLTWRLLNAQDHKPKKEARNVDLHKQIPQQMINQLNDKEINQGKSLIQVIPEAKRRGSIIDDGKQQQTLKRKESGREKEIYFEFADEEREIPDDLQNQKGLEVIERIKKKLQGRDFKEHEVLSTESQVNQLILQATNHENIAQAYLGWCPFW
ncbi:unnamed protein product [Paramecium octaurelia]|uniref:Serine/threonine-protein kinase TOR n=1 Tax=Paramecium octaurelia TaxID=43137 RepID=A0A8S1W6H3_PAROT|nr:unnamed protein product [Paramecium octaurelia]